MVLVFDLNGTLLNSQALDPVLRTIFRGKLKARDWFVEVLQHSMAMSLAGDYRRLDEIAAGVLEMEAAARRIQLDTAGVARVLAALRTLPPFKDVERTLQKLKQANFRLAVLSNSSLELLQRQVSNAHMAAYFEQALSVEQLRRYKPSTELYEFAASSLGVPTGEILMVAAHHWDLLGAARAGCQTAFIRRPGTALFPHAPAPTYVAKDLADLAGQLDPALKPASTTAVMTAVTTAVAVAAAGVVIGAARSRWQSGKTGLLAGAAKFTTQ